MAFDCSQFVCLSIPKNESHRIEQNWQNASDLSIEAETDQSKLDYVRNVAREPDFNQVFRVSDEEFQGVFEDWESAESPPAAINSLASGVSQLVETFGPVLVVIVQSATTNGDRVWRSNASRDDFARAVFHRSLFSHDQGAGSEVSVLFLH